MGRVKEHFIAEINEDYSYEDYLYEKYKYEQAYKQVKEEFHDRLKEESPEPKQLTEG